MSGCDVKCWNPYECPDHGDLMAPRGRDAGMGYYHCCDNYQRVEINPRHLWHEHDSTRWYTDPEGWNEHEATCERCNPTLATDADGGRDE